MVKRVISVLMIIMSVAFSISRIDNSKSITTNYLLLSTVEKQNIEQINNAIRFNTPSYSYNGNIMNSSPIPTASGKHKVILGSAINGNIVRDDIYKLNNNYVFPFFVEYNNYEKSLRIEGVEGFSEEPKIEEFELSDGTKVNLVIGR